MKKVALILHGFPGLTSDDPIRKYVSTRKFKVVLPNLFEEGVNFDEVSLVKSIDTLLGKSRPDVIIAASLGGLIVPKIAKKYPDAKLILIATGTRVKTKIAVYNMLAKSGYSLIFKIIVNVTRHIPDWFSVFVYKFFNPIKGKTDQSGNYESHIVEVLHLFKSFSHLKITQISKFAKHLNNTEILKTLKNRTLIMVGDNDVMMPSNLSYELKALIPGSRLIHNKKRLHHNVLDERDFEKIDKFLNS